MICGVCGRDAKKSRVIDKKFHCRDCEYALSHPKLVVTSPWGLMHRGIFDSKGKVIQGGIKSLERCGFRLYNHKQFLKSSMQYHYSNVYTFRYFGNVICRRLKGIQQVWPKHFRECALPCR